MSGKGMSEKSFMLLLILFGVIIFAVIIFLFAEEITDFGISLGEYAGSLIPHIKRVGG